VLYQLSYFRSFFKALFPRKKRHSAELRAQRYGFFLL